jgi:hypothetical protein
VPGATPAEVDVARSAVRTATTPARVATGTRRPPTYADRSDANQSDKPRNNNVYYGSIVFLMSFFLDQVSPNFFLANLSM